MHALNALQQEPAQTDFAFLLQLLIAVRQIAITVHLKLHAYPVLPNTI